jgi:hypothetical protein
VRLSRVSTARYDTAKLPCAITVLDVSLSESGDMLSGSI